MLQVTIIAYLGADAEVKEYNGNKFLSFRVAHTESYTNGQGVKHERTTWVGCVKNLYNGDSKLLQYLRKGTQVYLRGDLAVGTYNGQNGVQVDVKCRVKELQLLGSSQQSQSQQSNNAEAHTAAPQAQEANDPFNGEVHYDENGNPLPF
jgi:single-strand DNA-binding protein